MTLDKKSKDLVRKRSFFLKSPVLLHRISTRHSKWPPSEVQCRVTTFVGFFFWVVADSAMAGAL